MIKRILLKIARAILNEVLGQIAQQINVLDDMVRAPIQAMVGEVTSGVWTGRGAEAFVQECTNMFIPETQGIVQSCNTMATSINRAADIMDNADKQARGMVDSLAGVFQGIY
jgi:uncharacterized protein YukE